jgi:hypothetical protein
VQDLKDLSNPIADDYAEKVNEIYIKLDKNKGY